MLDRRNPQDLEQVKEDLAHLRELTAYFTRLEEAGELDENQEKHKASFADMLQRMETGRLSSLSAKQRSYVVGVHERVMGTPKYENLVSQGLASRGKEVPLPEVLRPENLPKFPPHRRPK